MAQRTTFQIGISQPERQIAEIQRLRDSLGIAAVVINMKSRTVTFEHDERSVTVARIETALRDLRLNPSRRVTVDI